MGRKPKPLTVHLRNGTYKPSRHGVHPMAAGELIKPSDLKGEAAKLWERVADFCMTGGSGECDTDLLAGMCSWYAEYRRVAAAMVTLTPIDEDYKPLQYLAANAWRQFVDMASRFGLSPADRAKLKTSSDEATSKLDQMFGNRAS